jgi:hypothetical protein
MTQDTLQTTALNRGLPSKGDTDDTPVKKYEKEKEKSSSSFLCLNVNFIGYIMVLLD